MLKVYPDKLNELFYIIKSKRWKPLTSEKDLSNRAGVYLIGYSKENLENQKIDFLGESEKNIIWYIGSSLNLRRRIKNFLSAIKKGEDHSGGNTYYREYKSKWKGEKFYIVYLSVDEFENKDEYLANIMRVPAVFEYYLIGLYYMINNKLPTLSREKKEEKKIDL
ncbi:MAG: hypothetical protein Fur0023_15580 [Bacteroidia bacterium]